MSDVAVAFAAVSGTENKSGSSREKSAIGQYSFEKMQEVRGKDVPLSVQMLPVQEL